jgi:hypothetical protein
MNNLKILGEALTGEILYYKMYLAEIRNLKDEERKSNQQKLFKRLSEEQFAKITAIRDLAARSSLIKFIKMMQEKEQYTIKLNYEDGRSVDFKNLLQQCDPEVLVDEWVNEYIKKIENGKIGGGGRYLK